MFSIKYQFKVHIAWCSPERNFGIPELYFFFFSWTHTSPYEREPSHRRNISMPLTPSRWSSSQVHLVTNSSRRKLQKPRSQETQGSMQRELVGITVIWRGVRWCFNILRNNSAEQQSCLVTQSRGPPMLKVRDMSPYLLALTSAKLLKPFEPQFPFWKLRAADLILNSKNCCESQIMRMISGT